MRLQRLGSIGVYLGLLILSACAPRAGGALTPTPGASPAAPIDVIGAQPCAFMWAYKHLPDVAADIQAALQTEELTGWEVAAIAFGENCVDENGQIQSFDVIQTDLRLRASFPPGTTREEMGNQLAQVLAVLAQFPVQDLPGPNPGQVSVEMQGDQPENLSFLRTAAEQALANGLTGEALLNELSQ